MMVGEVRRHGPRPDWVEHAWGGHAICDLGIEDRMHVHTFSSG